MSISSGFEKRVKLSILQNFTYHEVENKTGISCSTLKRLASGDREPKLFEIRLIAKVTGVNPIWLAFGNGEDENTIEAFPSDITNEKNIQFRIIASINDMSLNDLIFTERLIKLIELQAIKTVSQ